MMTYIHTYIHTCMTNLVRAILIHLFLPRTSIRFPVPAAMAGGGGEGGSRGVPPGWADRNNAMSEHDRGLGGDAANRFSRSGAYAGLAAAEAGGGTTYQTSDEVREHYLRKIEAAKEDAAEAEAAETEAAAAKEAAALPSGWEARQRRREGESRQQGTFSRDRVPPPAATAAAPHQGGGGRITTTTTATTNSTTTTASFASTTAEAALVRVATAALTGVADALGGGGSPAAVPEGDRAAFAAAIMRAMDALARSRSE